jgi:hypothetical protein
VLKTSGDDEGRREGSKHREEEAARVEVYSEGGGVEGAAVWSFFSFCSLRK